MTAGIRGVVPTDQMDGEDDEETLALRDLLERAKSFLASHGWCEGVVDEWFGFGIGGVVAVFLMHTKVKKVGNERLWVVAGDDVPSAYMVTDQAKDPAEALEVYAGLMEDWVDAVKAKADLCDVFPVDLPADERHASEVLTRMAALRELIIPEAHARIWP